MSDGGRGRAPLGVEVWKSSQKWSVWLGVALISIKAWMRGYYHQPRIFPITSLTTLLASGGLMAFNVLMVAFSTCGAAAVAALQATFAAMRPTMGATTLVAFHAPLAVAQIASAA